MPACLRAASRRLIALALTCGLATATCGSADPANGARTEFTAQGSGPANSASLYPMFVGLFGTNGGVFDGVVRLKAGRALRVSNRDTSRADYYLADAAGVYIAGNNLDGELAKPVLQVPATVRLGMAWDAYVDGDSPAAQYVVTARKPDIVTRFGKRTVWTIRQTKVDGKVEDRTYIEGIGPESVAFAATAVAASSHEPKAIAMQKMPLPADVEASFRQIPWVESLSMVQPSPGGPSLLMFNGTLEIQGGTVLPAKFGCVQTDGQSVAMATAEMGPTMRKTQGLVCPKSDWCIKGKGGSRECSPYLSGHGNGAVVGTGGAVTWIARGSRGEVIGARMENAGNYGTVSQYEAFFLTPSSTGNGVVAALTNLAAGTDELYIGGSLVSPLLGPDEGFVAKPWVLLMGEQWPEQVIPLAESNGGRRALLLTTQDGMLWSSRLEAERVTPPVAQFRYTGRLSVHATASGNEVLRVTGDGTVDRVKLQGDAVQLEHVGAATLPKNETAIGAFLVPSAGGTHLLVATFTGDGKDGIGAVVRLNLFRSTGFVTPSGSAPVPSPAGVYALSIANAVSGQGADMQVSFPPAHRPTDLEGFRLGGQKPAFTLRPTDDSNCVVMYRNYLHGAARSQPYDYNLMEGQAPGLGNFALAVTLGPIGYQNPGKLGIAMLKGGGFVGERQLFGRGGVQVGMPMGAAHQYSLQSGVADLGGHGLWLVNKPVKDGSKDEGTELRLLSSGKPVTVRFSDPGSSYGLPQKALFAVQGGGIAVSYGSNAPLKLNFVRVSPTGTQTPFAAPGDLREYCAMLADGTLCGDHRLADGSDVFFCFAPDGKERVAAKPLGVLCNSTALPLPDGHILVSNGSGVHVLDTQAMAVKTLTPYAMFPPTVASDGTLWGVFRDDKQKVMAVQFLSSGVKAVVLPPDLEKWQQAEGKGFTMRNVIADESMLLIQYLAGTASVGPLFRIARP